MNPTNVGDSQQCGSSTGSSGIVVAAAEAFGVVLAGFFWQTQTSICRNNLRHCRFCQNAARPSIHPL
jgi:hypothetical protein